MKICIPTMDDRGREGMPSDHFGSAPFFTFVDTEGEVFQRRLAAESFMESLDFQHIYLGVARNSTRSLRW